MKKTIDFDGYNEAEIIKLYEDGACACTLRQIEEEQLIKEDKDIILFDGVHFVLTEEEKSELRPIENAAEAVIRELEEAKELKEAKELQ